MKLDTKTSGALKRIIEEVEEKRKFRCINIDCPCNDNIGGNDIDIIKKALLTN